MVHDTVWVVYVTLCNNWCRNCGIMLKKCERVNKLKLKLNSPYFLLYTNLILLTMLPLYLSYNPLLYYLLYYLPCLYCTLYSTLYYTNLILPPTNLTRSILSSYPSFYTLILPYLYSPSPLLTIPLNPPFLYTYYKTLNFSLTTL